MVPVVVTGLSHNHTNIKYQNAVKKNPRKLTSMHGLGPTDDADRSIRVQGVPLNFDLTTTRNSHLLSHVTHHLLVSNEIKCTMINIRLFFNSFGSTVKVMWRFIFRVLVRLQFT